MAKKKLPGKIAALDEVDEKYRDLYEEREGAFYLQASGVDGMVPAEHAAELRKDLERANATLRGLQALGDPAKIKAQLEKLAAREADDAKAEGRWHDLEKQLVAAHAAEKAAWTTREQTLLGAIEERGAKAEATSALSAAKGKVGPMLPHIMQHLRMVEKDGKWVTEVHRDGKPWVKDGAGTPMTPQDVVDHYKKDPDYGGNFDGSKATGTNADPNATAPGNQQATGNAEFIANLPKIASGEVKVAVPAGV